MSVALYEGAPKGKRKGKQEFAMGQQMSNVIRSEPTVVACALNRSRFYLYTNREPVDTDDAAVVRLWLLPLMYLATSFIDWLCQWSVSGASAGAVRLNTALMSTSSTFRHVTYHLYSRRDCVHV